MLIHQFNMLRSINQTNINIWIKISNIKITLIKSKNGHYRCVDRYLNLESFCRMMLSFSSSLLSWLGALSTMAIVLNHVSVLHVSRNGCWNGESVDIWRNMSIADPMKVCQWESNKKGHFLLELSPFKTQFYYVIWSGSAYYLVYWFQVLENNRCSLIIQE